MQSQQGGMLMSIIRLIDADAVVNRLNKAIDVFEQNNAHFEAMGILYAKEIIESDIECPTITPEKALMDKLKGGEEE